MDLIQNSAISFSVCLDNKFRGLQPLLEELKRKFKVVCHEDVSLYTIRHFNDTAVKSLQNGKSMSAGDVLVVAACMLACGMRV